MKKLQVLIIDTNTDLFDHSAPLWEHYHIYPTRVDNISEALSQLSLQEFHLVVVVEYDGMRSEVLERLHSFREITNAPIVIASIGPVREIDSIIAFDTGADDVYEMPKTIEAAVAKGNAIIRRYVNCKICPKPCRNFELAANRYIVLNAENMSVYVKGNPVSLTKMEFEILKFLMFNPGQVLTCEQIYNAAYKEDAEEVNINRTVYTRIGLLREKIQIDKCMPELIKTRRGAGYIFDLSQ